MTKYFILCFALNKTCMYFLKTELIIPYSRLEIKLYLNYQDR